MRVNAVQGTDSTGNAVTSNVTGSGDFASCLKTTASLEEIFTEASERYQVPKNLIKAIAKAESDFDPAATSRCGAQGVMQLMPATAQYLGVEDAYDPYQNIMGGTKYISQLLDKYDGNVQLALAAYNAGSGNVAKYGGIPPFKETQNYVVKVTNYMNEGVSVPSVSYNVSQGTAAGTSASQSQAGTGHQNILAGISSSSVEEVHNNYLQKILEQIFSYEDYLKFIELYTKRQEEEREQEENAKEQQKKETQFACQYTSYHPVKMNLLNGI